jgi:hypothetical protein
MHPYLLTSEISTAISFSCARTAMRPSTRPTLRLVRLSGGDVIEVAGTVEVEAPGGDDVAGLRIRRATRIKPGTRVDVDAPGARRVTGVEIGGSDE